MAENDDEKELFGFNEKELFRRLEKALNDLHQERQEERDKHGEPNPVMGKGPDTVFVRDDGEGEGVEAGRLHIYAELEGRQVYTIKMTITIS